MMKTRSLRFPLGGREDPAAHPGAAALVRCAVALALVALAAPRARAGDIRVSHPAGGPEIVLAGGGSTEVVCIAVAVPVGSAREDAGMRGASHLVEHMVFNGSERFTREEMSGWIDDVGGFLNAFTRRETTVYFLVVPSGLFERGLDVLSQMLLRSVFPPAELEKERKVILEEIRRETDNPRLSRGRLVDRVLYRGSPLAEPIIGYPSTIERMSRDDIVGFYRRHYDPSRMRIVLMGGYDPARAVGLVTDHFGGAPAAAGGSGGQSRGGARRAEPRASLRGESLMPRWSGEIAVRSGAPGGGFDMLVPFPAVGDPDFPAALVLSKLIAGEEAPLAKELSSRSLPAAEVSLEISGTFSALRIHVGAPDSLAAACREIPSIVRGLSRWTPPPEAVEKTKTAHLAANMLDGEMYHLYVMFHGEAIGLHGAAYLDQASAGVARVTARACARVLERRFGSLEFNACLLAAGPSAGGPPEDATAPSFVETLPDGCVIGGAAREGSPVAAVHLMFRGRNCVLGSSMPGLVELLMTVLESSPAGAELERKLEALGARVAFGDNPYVPHDDYLLSPAFAFVRLEAPAERLEAAADLLASHLADAAVAHADLDAARADAARELGMRSGSPYSEMRAAMMKALFADHPYGEPLFPPPPAAAAASAEGLSYLRARLFARGNIVATIVSPWDHTAARAFLADLVRRFPPGPAVECPALPDSAAARTVEKTIRKEGAYLAAGWLVGNVSEDETAATIVAGEILARRMQLELRERQGLAYSIDCSASPVPGGTIVMAYLGTGAPRIEEARAGLEREIRGLIGRLPDDDEIATAKSRLLGKRSRSGLSSVNAAYALGLDILLGAGPRPRSLERCIAAATGDGVRSLIERALAMERAVELRLVPETAAPRK